MTAGPGLDAAEGRLAGTFYAHHHCPGCGELLQTGLVVDHDLDDEATPTTTFLIPSATMRHVCPGPLSPSDLAAAICDRLGIDKDKPACSDCGASAVTVMSDVITQALTAAGEALLQQSPDL